MTTEKLMSPGDLDYVRTCAAGLLGDRCDLWDRVEAQDGQGGMSVTYEEVAESVPCRISEIGGKEKFLAGQLQVDSKWRISLLFDQHVTTDMRVIHQGITYEITFVNIDQSLDTVRRCRMKELEG